MDSSFCALPIVSLKTMTTPLLAPGMLELVAERFRALSEPARLRLLNALRDGEKTASQLMEATGLRRGAVARHLQLLHYMGFVNRRRSGPLVHYALADEDVFTLCDLMCGRLQARGEARGVVPDPR